MSNNTFLDVTQIISDMNNESSITDLVGDRIFDGVPDFTNFTSAKNKDYLIIEIVSQNVNECSKTSRMTVRIMSGKRSGTNSSMRNIYKVVREFLVSNTKDFGTFSTWSVSENNYREIDDQDGKRMIVNDYLVSFLYDN